MICTMSKHAAMAKGCSDAMMYDYRGYVAEATGANIFFVKDGEVHTPKADAFLNGITRQTVIGMLKDIGLMRRDGKPDTHNTACMTNCVAEVRLSSQIPEYARDAHGNLAEQSRTVATAAAAPTGTAPRAAASDAATLARQAACMACHGISDKVVGPAFRDVAQKYAGEPGAEARLAAKVRAGGVGAWGNVAMPAQAQVSEGEARTLVRWILAGAK